MNALCMLAPALPPARGGLADYTAQLWSQLGAPPCTFFVASGAAASAPALGGDVRALPTEAELTACVASISARTLVVQYVGYGFAQSGAPSVLTRALADWRRADTSRRLLVFFHEIWASGPPWTRAFWTHRAQRHATCTLARAADLAFVTSLAAADLLLAATDGAVRPLLQPIPSNIDVVAPRAAREGGLHVAVFGLPQTRLAALATFRGFLHAQGRGGVLSRVTLIGGAPPAQDARGELHLARLCAGPASVELLCDATPALVSRTLASADLALSPTPAHLVTKSGASMAALAHGVALAVAPAVAPGTAARPLAAGREVLELDASGRVLGVPMERGALDTVGLAGQRWYAQHASWPIQRARWLRVLGGESALG